MANYWQEEEKKSLKSLMYWLDTLLMQSKLVKWPNGFAAVRDVIDEVEVTYKHFANARRNAREEREGES